ncbi:MAG: CHAT domain-containing protein [Armatimonadetes bacterium]|nr:CHAT domain-containing protein [Armatimonadota bacterium]
MFADRSLAGRFVVVERHLCQLRRRLAQFLAIVVLVAASIAGAEAQPARPQEQSLEEAVAQFIAKSYDRAIRIVDDGIELADRCAAAKNADLLDTVYGAAHDKLSAVRDDNPARWTFQTLRLGENAEKNDREGLQVSSFVEISQYSQTSDKVPILYLIEIAVRLNEQALKGKYQEEAALVNLNTCKSSLRSSFVPNEFRMQLLAKACELGLIVGRFDIVEEALEVARPIVDDEARNGPRWLSFIPANRMLLAQRQSRYADAVEIALSSASNLEAAGFFDQVAFLYDQALVFQRSYLSGGGDMPINHIKTEVLPRVDDPGIRIRLEAQLVAWDFFVLSSETAVDAAGSVLETAFGQLSSSHFSVFVRHDSALALSVSANVLLAAGKEPDLVFDRLTTGSAFYSGLDPIQLAARAVSKANVAAQVDMLAAYAALMIGEFGQAEAIVLGVYSDPEYDILYPIVASGVAQLLAGIYINTGRYDAAADTLEHAYQLVAGTTALDSILHLSMLNDLLVATANSFRTQRSIEVAAVTEHALSAVGKRYPMWSSMLHLNLVGHYMAQGDALSAGAHAMSATEDLFRSGLPAADVALYVAWAEVLSALAASDVESASTALGRLEMAIDPEVQLSGLTNSWVPELLMQAVVAALLLDMTQEAQDLVDLAFDWFSDDLERNFISLPEQIVIGRMISAQYLKAVLLRLSSDEGALQESELWQRLQYLKNIGNSLWSIQASAKMAISSTEEGAELLKEIQRLESRPPHSGQGIAARTADARLAQAYLELAAMIDVADYSLEPSAGNWSDRLEAGDLLLDFYEVGVQDWRKVVVYVATESGLQESFVVDASFEELSNRVKRLVDALNSEGRSEPVLAPPGNIGPIWEEPAKKLYDLLIRPVENLLAKSDRLIVIGDGIIHNVVFPALSDGEKFLIEKVTFERWMPGRLRNSSAEAGPSLVVANPDYDFKIAATPANRVGTVTWTQLNGTSTEGDEISKLLGVVPVTGPKATEDALKAVESPRVLHIATHGFFETSSAKADQATGSFGMFSRNPYKRSGLVLAGANVPGATLDQDGILDSRELLQINLSGTELVVLSACETGQGVVADGMGVIGLQRSVLGAGAKNVVMSHFRVPDEATVLLMIAFYESWLGGQRVSDALSFAQRKMLADPNTRDPRNWAAFSVLVGVSLDPNPRG